MYVPSANKFSKSSSSTDVTNTSSALSPKFNLSELLSKRTLSPPVGAPPPDTKVPRYAEMLFPASVSVAAALEPYTIATLADPPDTKGAGKFAAAAPAMVIPTIKAPVAKAVIFLKLIFIFLTSFQLYDMLSMTTSRSIVIGLNYR